VAGSILPRLPTVSVPSKKLFEKIGPPPAPSEFLSHFFQVPCFFFFSGPDSCCHFPPPPVFKKNIDLFFFPFPNVGPSGLQLNLPQMKFVRRLLVNTGACPAFCFSNVPILGSRGNSVFPRIHSSFVHIFFSVFLFLRCGHNSKKNVRFPVI